MYNVKNTSVGLFVQKVSMTETEKQSDTETNTSLPHKQILLINHGHGWWFK